MSNNTVEVMALFWGLKLVISVGGKDVKIEGDFKVIIETVKGNTREGWAIKRVIEDIRYFLSILNRFNLNHILKEGNSAANDMLVLGLKVEGLRCWRDLNALLKLVRELVSHEVKNDELCSSVFCIMLLSWRRGQALDVHMSRSDGLGTGIINSHGPRI